jgi:hypothetical protein
MEREFLLEQRLKGEQEQEDMYQKLQGCHL